jgi:hypothetical protein
MTVNRPFAAFGALAAFASLAMFAVSSTSRSTSVQAGRTLHRPSAQQQWRGANYVLILPAAAAPEFICDDAESATDENSCEPTSRSLALRVGVGEAGGRSLNDLPTNGLGRQSSIRTARVELAQDSPKAWRMPAAVDYRSIHDRVYDRIVYGAAVDEVVLLRGTAGVVSGRRDAGPTMLVDEASIFQSFVAPQRQNRPLPQAGARRFEGPRLRTVVMTMGRWLTSQIQRVEYELILGMKRTVAAKTGAIDWAEYSELIERATGPDALTALSATTSDANEGVRSSGWLRHSAASRLYQLGLLLQAAALELEREAAGSRAAGIESLAR